MIREARPQIPAATMLCLVLAGCCFETTKVWHTASSPHRVSRPRIEVPRTDDPPAIDGDLTDDVWDGAAVLHGLGPCVDGRHRDRIEQTPTEVRVLWDKKHLYVSFACMDDDIFCSGKLRHDENLYTEDVCEVFLDGVGDGRQWIEIQGNPSGESLDMMHLLTTEAEQVSSGRLLEDIARRDLWRFRQWDMKGLQIKSGRLRRDGKVTGWTLEMAIPAGPVVKRLGLKGFQPMYLRANFIRYDWQAARNGAKRDLVHMNWSPVQFGCPHISPGAMGHLLLQAGSGDKLE